MPPNRFDRFGEPVEELSGDEELEGEDRAAVEEEWLEDVEDGEILEVVDEDEVEDDELEVVFDDEDVSEEDDDETVDEEDDELADCASFEKKFDELIQPFLLISKRAIDD